MLCLALPAYLLWHPRLGSWGRLFAGSPRPKMALHPKLLTQGTPIPFPIISDHHKYHDILILLLKFSHSPIKSFRMKLSPLSHQIISPSWVSGLIMTWSVFISHPQPSIPIFQASSSLALSCTIFIPNHRILLTFPLPGRWFLLPPTPILPHKILTMLLKPGFNTVSFSRLSRH